MTSNNKLDNLLVDYLGESKPTMVEFYNPGCDKCLATLPVLDELKTKFKDRANVVAVNKDESQDLVEKYHLHSYPTFILFKDGQEVWRDGGAKPLSELTDMVRRFL